MTSTDERTATPDADAADTLTLDVERLPGSQASVRVEVPAAGVDAAVDHAVRHLARRVRIPGFRPGKAPAHMVERVLGWPAVARETLDEFVPSWYGKALEQGGLEVVGDPELNLGELGRGVPFSFTATVTVTPEVDLGDYLAIRVDPPTAEVGEEQVDEAVEDVRRRAAELVDVDRPAEHGDVLLARIEMRRDGEVVGGSDREREVELERDRLLPGLADALLGLEAGASATVPITLPDDYERPELQGVEVQFAITVTAVRERRLPPLDDSLATLAEHGTTLAELRDWWRQQLQDQADRQAGEHHEAEVLERLRDVATVDIPEVMVDREVDRQLRDLERQLADMGMRLDRYLEVSGQTIEQVRAGRREGAVQRVKIELVLEKLADAEGLEIDEADVEREEARLAGSAKLTAEQRRRIHLAAHRDLLLRAAAQRAIEIARGE
ncbi:MAG TPA: trigger factor [Candidatus Dormibacteraeota bacterium]|nr:trigger factor [Candidatus Dormibacteraeota bacterium]